MENMEEKYHYGKSQDNGNLGNAYLEGMNSHVQALCNRYLGQRLEVLNSGKEIKQQLRKCTVYLIWISSNSKIWPRKWHVWVINSKKVSLSSFRKDRVLWEDLFKALKGEVTDIFGVLSFWLQHGYKEIDATTVKPTTLTGQPPLLSVVTQEIFNSSKRFVK